MATMLRETRPDLVSICTPNKFHHPATLLALEHGAHVMSEKPMAMTVAEAEAMEAARSKTGKLGGINFSYRNVPAFRFARELIAAGELGRILRVNTVYLQSFLGAPATAHSWRNDAALAGFGALGILCGLRLSPGPFCFDSPFPPRRACSAAGFLFDLARAPRRMPLREPPTSVRAARGPPIMKRKLTDRQCAEIRELRFGPVKITYRELAERYGVTYSTIYRAVNEGVRWARVNYRDRKGGVFLPWRPNPDWRERWAEMREQFEREK
jgi:hypothetical protein